MLAFSAIRNNNKVGLILFSDEVEKFIPPRKGRSHVLRVIREVLFFEPERRGTDLNEVLEFMGEVLPHKAIVVVISDFISPQRASGILPEDQISTRSPNPLPQPVQTSTADISPAASSICTTSRS